MDNPVLTKKRKIKTADGDMMDLSLPTIDKKRLFVVENMHFVQEEEAMRLDLIANKYYGWTDKLDAILWANNIFNPFSIEEHTWLIIPKVKDDSSYAVNPPVSSMPAQSSQSTTSKISKAAEKLNTASNKAKEERQSRRTKKRPNELGQNETYKTVDGASILLG